MAGSYEQKGKRNSIESMITKDIIAVQCVSGREKVVFKKVIVD